MCIFYSIWYLIIISDIMQNLEKIFGKKEKRIEAVWDKRYFLDRKIKVKSSTHPKCPQNTRLGIGSLITALDEKYSVLIKRPKPIGSIIARMKTDSVEQIRGVKNIIPMVVESDHPKYVPGTRFDYGCLTVALDEEYSVIITQ